MPLVQHRTKTEDVRPCAMVLPNIDAVRAGQSDPLICLEDQLYSNDGRIELPKSDNCFRLSGLLSTWSRSLPKGLCFPYGAVCVRK